jgi:simple sugar transport system permease protein
MAGINLHRGNRVTPGSLWQRVVGGKLFWPVATLAAVLLFNLIFTPGFADLTVREGRLSGSLIDILRNAAPVMLVALGMTLVIATGGVDLSVGAVMALSGAVAAGMITGSEHTALRDLPLTGSFTAAAALALAVSLAAGLWNGALVAILEVQPIVATLILMVAGRGLAQLINDGQNISFEDPAFVFLANGSLFGLPLPIVLVAVALVLSWLVTRRTALGLFIEAVGNNATASRYVGIDTRKVKLFVYGYCGLCAGLAGLLGASEIKVADSNNAGLYLELDAILAVVIGGTALAGGRFSFFGSLLGAVLIQTVTTMINTRGIPAEYSRILKALVVLGVCLLQSEAFRQSIVRRLTRERP